MPAHRVPLIWSGKTQKEKTLNRYDPIGKNIVNVMCYCGLIRTISSNPINLIAVLDPSDASICTISWSEPVSSGGTNIITYRISANPGNLSGVVDGDTTSFVLTGLIYGYIYTISVTAVNSIGNSEPSTITIRIPIAPSAPINLLTSIDQINTNTCILSWSAPTSDGGSPLTSYSISGSPGNLLITTIASTTSYTFNGLIPGTLYTFVVTARNSAGSSLPTTITVRIPTVPSAPINLSTNLITTLIPNGANIDCTILWDEPVSNGWSPITGYSITGLPGNFSGLTTGSTRSYSFTGIMPIITYTFSVIAKNIVGNSVPATINVSVPIPPSEPTNLLANIVNTPIPTGTNIDCVVSWNNPASDGGAVITGYRITGSPGNFLQLTTPSTKTYTFTGLSSVTSYTFNVIAINSEGNSLPSTLTITTPPVYTVIQIFTSDGMFTMPTGNPKLTNITPINLFIVAGGGGGGKILSVPLPTYAYGDAASYCGGGGAGGILQETTTMSLGTSHIVSIGTGGDTNMNGNPSSFDTFTALGGGRGATIGGSGGTGGSGGGGGAQQGSAGSGTVGQGFNGGANGGGGGGAGSVGVSFNMNLPNGGDGIDYHGNWYGGGGGGMNGDYDYRGGHGEGGRGGGGRGGCIISQIGPGSEQGYPGIANTGGGGGAGWAGGSGIVIISAII